MNQFLSHCPHFYEQQGEIAFQANAEIKLGLQYNTDRTTSAN